MCFIVYVCRNTSSEEESTAVRTPKKGRNDVSIDESEDNSDTASPQKEGIRTPKKGRNDVSIDESEDNSDTASPQKEGKRVTVSRNRLTRVVHRGFPRR